MDYPEVLTALKQRRCVLVTGPQRSGTTIAARCLALDLALPFLPEETFGTTDAARFFSLLGGLTAGVVQAPALAFLCHLLPPHVAVVWMQRAVADVVRSQERIGWEWEAFELARYFRKPPCSPIAAVKGQVWQEFQRGQIATALDLDYDSLRGHPLWVEPEQRRHFGARQTSLP